MKKENYSENFWKGISLVLIALALFLAIADVSIRPRYMNDHMERQPATRQTQQTPQPRGGMVGGC